MKDGLATPSTQAMIERASFRAPLWARSTHLQTVWGPTLRRTRAPERRIEAFRLPDGDHLWLHHAGPEPAPGQARLLLLHGLSGCADSVYLQGLQRALSNRGLPSTVMNARGAWRPNDRARGYHAGEIDDFDALVRELHARDSNAPLPTVGFSLGGSRLLNWLARGGHPAVPGALAVCVPLYLARGAERLNRGLSRFYRDHLIHQVVQQQKAKREHLRSVAPAEAERHEALGGFDGIRTFRDLDNRIIAPLHGFRDADDYYEQCSAGPKLSEITTPTRLLQAADDPFMTPACLPDEASLGEAVTLERSEHGGHVGFVRGTPVNPRYWLEERIPDWLRPWTG